MPIILAAVGILATAYIVFLRTGAAARAANDVLSATVDFRSVARRYGFRRRADAHPVDCVNDPAAAMAGIAAAFVEMDAMPSKRQWARLSEELHHHLRLTPPEGVELAVFGRWLVGQCGTPQAALSRLGRKLYKLRGAAAGAPMISIITNTLAAEPSDMSERQQDALHDIKAALRVR